MTNLVTLLWDRGFSFEDIKEKTGISIAQISEIIAKHCNEDSEEDETIGWNIAEELEE